MSRAEINMLRPFEHETLGRVYPFTMTQNSEAEIEVELDPKAALCCPTSALDTGDLLRATRISGYSKKVLGKAELIRGSENHRAQQTYTRQFGYAKIDIALRTVLGLMARQPAAQPQALPDLT